MLDVPPLGIRHCNLGVCVSLDLYWGWSLSCVCGIGLYWALNTSTVPVHWALNMLCLCNTAMPNLALSASCLACRGRPTIPVRRMLRAHTKLSWQVCAGAHVHERLVRVAGGSGAAPGMRAARCARTRAPRAWPTECVPSIRL